MFNKIVDLIIGIGSVLIGLVFLAVQILSYIGTISSGGQLPSFTPFVSWPVFFFDLFGFLGYNLCACIAFGFFFNAFFILKDHILPLIFGTKNTYEEE